MGWIWFFLVLFGVGCLLGLIYGILWTLVHGIKALISGFKEGWE